MCQKIVSRYSELTCEGHLFGNIVYTVIIYRNWLDSSEMRILGELLQSEEIQFCCFSDSMPEMKIQQHAILHQTKSTQFI